jgi:NAD(P)-dependent dehydrogenase (short-subunit alcohol dehydrogenase family)
MKAQSVAFVTGASSGLGRACALELARIGYRVYGSCRNPSRPGASAPGVEMLAMDVRDASSTARAAAFILGKEGRIDALVCCAGMGIAGAVEDCTMEEIQSQMDSNFLGTVRSVKAFLPAMRIAEKGKIIIIGSIAGVTGMPFQAFYSASKYALEGFLESLRYETRGFGIQACIVEPGDFRTGFTDARKKGENTSKSPYASLFESTMAVQIHDEGTGHEPSEVGRLVGGLLARPKLPVRVTVGPLFERFAVWMKRIMPGRVFEKFYRIYYKLP